MRDLTETLRDLAAPVAKHGSFNFLLSNGDALWAHCSTSLHWLQRRHPFREARLQDQDLTVNFAELTTPQDRVAVVVTEPLTADEAWAAFAPGELKAFQGGAPLAA